MLHLGTILPAVDVAGRTTSAETSATGVKSLPLEHSSADSVAAKYTDSSDPPAACRQRGMGLVESRTLFFGSSKVSVVVVVAARIEHEDEE